MAYEYPTCAVCLDSIRVGGHRGESSRIFLIPPPELDEGGEWWAGHGCASSFARPEGERACTEPCDICEEEVPNG